jgi:hypothetical protein
VKVGEDKAGGTHGTFQVTLYGEGVTADGDKVTLNTGTHNVDNAHLDGSPHDFIVVSPATLIVQGEDGTRRDDLIAHFVLHYTINANGEITAEVLRIEAECR